MGPLLSCETAEVGSVVRFSDVVVFRGDVSTIATLSQDVPMRHSKFTEIQIVSILKEADAGRPVNEVWKTYGISSATYYKWKAKNGG